MDALEESVLVPLAGMVGKTTEVVALFLCIMACTPLAIFHRIFLFRRSPTLQHIYFMLSGLAFQWVILKWDIVHVIAPSLITYLIVCIMPAGTLRSAIVFVGNMGHLIWGFFAMHSDEYQIGWMTPGCVGAHAMIAFCMDLTDYKLPEEKKNADQKKLGISRVPSLLAFLGYKFNPITALAGPMLNFKEYENFVHGTHLKDFDTRKYSLCYYSIKEGVQCIVEAFIGLAFTFAGGAIVPPSFLLGDDFMEYNLVSRIALVTMHGMLDVSKYVGIWKLLEAAACFCTLGYSETTKAGPQFHTCRQVHFWQLFLPYNCSMFSVKFNCATHRFVKRYIFKRLAFLGNKNVSLAAAVLFISIWHGIHFGYFWTFFCCEFFTLLVEARYVVVLKNATGIHDVDALPLLPRIIVRLLSAGYTHLSVGYGYIGMSMLKLSNVLLVASRIYYYFHVGGIILLVLHVFLPSGWKRHPSAAVTDQKKKE